MSYGRTKKVKVDREELKKRYQKGVELMSSDDESEVHRGYDIMGELAAEGGLAESQFILGTYHLSKMERTEAKKWLDMAAEQGHEGAIACLKESFANGIGDE